MAVFKSGKRGRPLELDINKTWAEFYDLTPLADLRLRQLRQQSKGIRGEALLGSQTSLPDWIEESLDLLEEAQSGRDLSYKEAKQIKQNLESVKELTSNQRRVYERAINEQLTASYIDELTKYSESSQSDFAKKTISELKNTFSKLSKRSQQNILLSKYYQSPKATRGRYRKVKAWSERVSGRKNMTYDEAWAYLLKRRIEDGLD